MLLKGVAMVYACKIHCLGSRAALGSLSLVSTTLALPAAMAWVSLSNEHGGGSHIE